MSYPKINIFLHVRKKPAGAVLHEISSRFYRVKTCVFDEILIEDAPSFRIYGNFLCEMHQNLIFKAIFAMENFFMQKNLKSAAKNLCKISVKVHKKIPIFAGLGGGASNAGSVLLALGEFFDVPRPQILNLAQKISSDTSFFASDFDAANVSGHGEIVEFFDDLPLDFEIFTPKISCRTPQIFRAFDENPPDPKRENFTTKKSDFLLKNFDKNSLNDLFAPAISVHPELKEISKNLGEKFFFTGSGSSFFRIRE